MFHRSIAVAVALVLAIGVLAVGRAAGDDAPPIRAGEPTGRAERRADGGQVVRYRSTGVDGREDVQTAIVWRPTAPPSGHVVAWAHPTSGLADECAPSRTADPVVPGRAELLAAGHVVVAPDYEGLGTKGVHPYLVGPSEGRSILDALRAARALTGADGSTAVYGWSQGGHAALFAARLAPSYAPDVELVGAAAMAPVVDMPSLVNGTSPLSNVPGVVSMVAAGYVAAYDDLQPDELLAEPDRQLAGARNECDAAKALEGTETKRPSRAWLARLRQNDPASRRIDVPVLLAQGEQDWLLPMDAAVAAYDRLCEKGSTVLLARYANTDHANVPINSGPDILAWLGDRLDGVPIGGCSQWME